jgi:hypothetical protein
MLQAPDLHSVASAALAIFAQMRHVARDMLQVKITLEAQQLTRADVTPCCQEAGVTSVHTRTVSPEAFLGEITIPVRTFQCRGYGATFRPDDTALGVPEVGAFTDDVRWLYTPVAAEPTLGAVLARRYVSVLGSAEDLATHTTQVLREAGWEHIPMGEILGDGAPWIWNVADAHFPGVRQTLDYYPLSDHLYACAHLLYRNNPAGAKAWVDQNMGGSLRIASGRCWVRSSEGDPGKRPSAMR